MEDFLYMCIGKAFAEWQAADRTVAEKNQRIEILTKLVQNQAKKIQEFDEPADNQPGQDRE